MVAERQEEVLERSLTALRQGGKQAKVAALHALGRLDDRRAIPALVSALESGDRDIRALAAGKLVFLNNGRIVPALEKALDDKEPRVRQHALYALERLKARRSADKIAGLLIRDKNEIVRFNAARALAAVGGRRHKAAFVRALKDRNSDVVITCLRALARLAPREVGSHILRLAGQAGRWRGIPERQKDRILRLLRGSLKQRGVLVFLRKIVSDGIREARQQGARSFSMAAVEAASLLAEAGDASGLPVLMECLKGGEYSQERGLKALARLKERSAVPLIIEKPLQNGFYPIKLTAVRALGEIGDARALAALGSFFNDRLDDFPVDRSHVFSKDDPDLRLTALTAIARIAGQSLGEAAEETRR